jgi:hypothetical protein
LLRLVLLLLGIGLIVQGGLSAWFGATGVQPPAATSTFFTVGTLHGLVHVAEGLLVLLLPFWLDDRATAVLGLAFGFFNVFWGALFLVFDRPLGMPYESSQNIVHFIDGPLVILLALWALWTTRAAAPPTGQWRVAP